MITFSILAALFLVILYAISPAFRDLVNIPKMRRERQEEKAKSERLEREKAIRDEAFARDQQRALDVQNSSPSTFADMVRAAAKRLGMISLETRIGFDEPYTLKEVGWNVTQAGFLYRYVGTRHTLDHATIYIYEENGKMVVRAGSIDGNGLLILRYATVREAINGANSFGSDYGAHRYKGDVVESYDADEYQVEWITHTDTCATYNTLKTTYKGKIMSELVFTDQDAISGQDIYESLVSYVKDAVLAEDYKEFFRGHQTLVNAYFSPEERVVIFHAQKSNENTIRRRVERDRDIELTPSDLRKHIFAKAAELTVKEPTLSRIEAATRILDEETSYLHMLELGDTDAELTYQRIISPCRDVW